MDILEKAVEKLRNGEEFVMITVVETTGSVPSKIGSRMIVSADTTEGTVGGGALENDAVEKARILLHEKGDASFVRIKTSELDMHCGGEVALLIEPFQSGSNLWVFGGGHIAKVLVPMAASTGFNVTVVDNRSGYASKDRFPTASAVLNTPYIEAAQKVPPGSFVVIITHKHAHDEEILHEVARITPHLPYIGMIGSAKKAKQSIKNLNGAGMGSHKNIYTPIGLNIGGDSPAEIALSIMSELVGILYNKKGLPHLRI